MRHKLTGIILAGGRSSRLNVNKAFLKLGSTVVFDKLLGIFRGLFDDIIIVANNPRRFKRYGVLVVKDAIVNKMALGGIYSGLIHSKNKYNFIAACDMPFINPRVVEYMKGFCGVYDVIVPRTAKGIEPLHAIYSKNCIHNIEQKIAEGELKTSAFYPRLKVKEISEKKLTRFDPALLSFFNINTQTDYKKALSICNQIPAD